MPGVYVMWSERAGHYKIGCGDVAERLKSHRTALPDVELVAAVTNPSAEAIEGQIHAYFTAARIGTSECFEPTPEVTRWVERFRTFPGVTSDVNGLGSSFSMPHIWPWADDYYGRDGEGQMSLSIATQYVPPQGSPTRDGQTSAISEDWYTPPPYIAAVRDVFYGRIDLDPASCSEANNTVQAEYIYTAEVDGLRQVWFGNVYVNPPWGKQGKAKVAFVRRAVAAYDAGEIRSAILALNSNATTSAWFAPLFRFPICFPNHRVAHYGPGGAGGSPNSGTVFVYIGPDEQRFADIFSQFGAVVPPAYATQRDASAFAENYDDEEVAA